MARQQLKGIVEDFVSEVEVCADIHHPNLVKLMGYATKPQLIIVQELLEGGSLDLGVSQITKRRTHKKVLRPITLAAAIASPHCACNSTLRAAAAGEAAYKKNDNIAVRCPLPMMPLSTMPLCPAPGAVRAGSRRSPGVVMDFWCRFPEGPRR
eukprot:COSAG01_NODE_26772_length_703_cov_18.923841_2_plen_153_part_00